MAFTSSPKRLWTPSQVAATNTTYYTVPSNTTTVLKHVTAHNTHASDNVDLTVYLVESGGSAGDSNQIYSETISAGQEIVVSVLTNHAMSTGDSVVMVAGTASRITVHGTGIEVT